MNKLTTTVNICFLVLVVSCDYSDSDTRLHPSVETLGVSITNDEEFNFEGIITRHSDLKVVDHGFIWNLSTEVTPGLYDQISLGPLSGESFSAKTKYGFNADFDYYIRAYAKTKKEIVYGNTIIIKPKNALTPIVEGFIPTSGVPGDTITIFGENLSANNAISDIRTDNYFKLPIINGGNSSIQVRAESEGHISFSSYPYYWESNDPFVLLFPSYSDHYPKVGTACDIITVEGKNFGNGVDFNEISIDGRAAKLLSATKTKIQFYLPLIYSGGTSSIRHKIGPKVNYYQFYYNLPLFPIFTTLSATKVTPGDIITINGNNIPFCSEESILVSLVGHGSMITLKKISTSETQIKVQIPKASNKGHQSILIQVLQWEFPFDIEII
ncbi:MAG: IPT/TIG domain-containing protein [Cyclobacteriaceae bacterium]|nr:IPT/TIG domain-containing protein [Cyclobacteriaceae bacterium]